MDTMSVERQVLQVLARARPDDMLAPLRGLLAEHLGARDVRILLANYQLTALRPICDSGAPEDAGERVELGDGPAGEAFAQQREVTLRVPDGGVVVCVPIGVRGERLGVLHLSVQDDPDEEALSGLRRIADTLAYALQAAAHQTDAMARAARSQRLTLAAELQWQLLPGRGCEAPEYELAGHLEPAYQVQADNFDWSQDGDRLVLSVTDAAHQQRGMSLLPTLAVTAVRNARRAGLGLADQAFLAGEAVYAHHQGKQHISTLLVGVDLTTGDVSAVRAGTPKLLILRGSDVLEPELTDQDPLGMFEGTEYFEQRLALVPGDRMLLLTDGAHAAHSPAREKFVDSALIDLLERTREEPIGAVLRLIIQGIYRHREVDELDDDAVLLMVDWIGPQGETIRRAVHPAVDCSAAATDAVADGRAFSPVSNVRR